MELNINSPAYFNQHYGVDDEVYQFCQKADIAQIDNYNNLNCFRPGRLRKWI